MRLIKFVGKTIGICTITLGTHVSDVGALPPLVDVCANASPDQLFYMPLGYPGGAFYSGSGFYGYRPCSYFILDVLMATYSGCSSGHCYSFHWDAGTYDLPSSGAVIDRGELPKNDTDCVRLIVWQREYLKLNSADSFTLTYQDRSVGSWDLGKCTLHTTSSSGKKTDINPSQGGGAGSAWDVYRLCVSVELRTSYQEAFVNLSKVIP